MIITCAMELAPGTLVRHIGSLTVWNVECHRGDDDPLGDGVTVMRTLSGTTRCEHLALSYESLVDWELA